MSNKNHQEELDVYIAVDAMGGDYAPDEIVRGVARATLESPTNILLVGDKKRISPVLEGEDHHARQIEIVHTDKVITHDDAPKEVVRKKADASMVVAAKLCGEGRAHGLISAGNTGAYVLSTVKHIPRLSGVRKTAIASVYPTQNAQQHQDIFSLLLDVGANVHCTMEELVQFAIMGKMYSSDIKEIPDPTVGLLNIGSEAHKGGTELKKTYDILQELSGINFVGNIEGNDLMKGKADVVVTEGFTGNIVLKLMEGIYDTLSHLGRYAFKHRFMWRLGLIALSGGLKELKTVTDYSEYGGAPLLGFKDIVIKAHGRSKAKAITNAIKVAAKTYRDDICGKIAREISDFEAHFNQK